MYQVTILLPPIAPGAGQWLWHVVHTKLVDIHSPCVVYCAEVSTSATTHWHGTTSCTLASHNLSPVPSTPEALLVSVQNGSTFCDCMNSVALQLLEPVLHTAFPSADETQLQQAQRNAKKCLKFLTDTDHFNYRARDVVSLLALLQSVPGPDDLALPQLVQACVERASLRRNQLNVAHTFPVAQAALLTDLAEFFHTKAPDQIAGALSSLHSSQLARFQTATSMGFKPIASNWVTWSKQWQAADKGQRSVLLPVLWDGFTANTALLFSRPGHENPNQTLTIDLSGDVSSSYWRVPLACLFLDIQDVRGFVGTSATSSTWWHRSHRSLIRWGADSSIMSSALLLVSGYEAVDAISFEDFEMASKIHGSYFVKAFSYRSERVDPQQFALLVKACAASRAVASQ